MGKKREKKFIPETGISRPKNRGKKRVKKIFQKHTNRVSKKFWKKKSSGKSAKTRFLYKINIVTKKWGGKKREKFFTEIHVYRKQKTMEKNRLEKVRKHVFYKHIMS